MATPATGMGKKLVACPEVNVRDKGIKTASMNYDVLVISKKKGREAGRLRLERVEACNGH